MKATKKWEPSIDWFSSSPKGFCCMWNPFSWRTCGTILQSGRGI